MTPVIPCSLSNISLVYGAPFTIRKINSSTKFGLSRKKVPQSLSTQRFVLPRSTSVKSFPVFTRQYVLNHRNLQPVLSATGTDVAVEEQDSPVDNEKDSRVQSDAGEDSEKSESGSATPQPKRSRPSRKSDLPPVKNEELVAGATFTGKVRAIQPFGAFVDFGAFTDGLVHVSRLSDSFVKDVSSIVSIGQEVKVRLVEANFEAGRISLSMRESDETTKRQPIDDNKLRSPRNNGSKGPQKKDDMRKTSKFVKGQDLVGTIKNLTRSGSFISLPEGEEGFLPTSEEADDGLGSMMGGSTLEVGQEVNVQVLRITRGKVTLTMKKEADNDKFDTVSQEAVHEATNPFVLAFRKNKDIAAFLDKREEEAEKEVGSVVSEEVKESVVLSENKREESSEATASDLNQSTVDPVAGKEEENEASNSSEKIIEEPVLSESSKDDEPVAAEADESLTIEREKQETGVIEESAIRSSAQSLIAGTEEGDNTSDLSEEINDQVVPSENPKDDEAVAENTQAYESTAKDKEKIPEENGSIANSEVQADLSLDDSKGESTENIVPLDLAVDQSSSAESKVSEDISQKEVVVEAEAVHAEVPASTDTEEETSSEKIGIPTNSDSESLEKSSKATISPALVKQLREETGAGMMDCKKALSETDGDIGKAQEYLRKKGLASADKKASRDTAEGRIGSYIHDSRIGVLLEVNCETDFVSRGEIFKELVEDLAMQVAACPQVQYLVTEDIPNDFVKKETEIEMQKEDLLSKPEQIRVRIVEGRIRKRLEELALLEQPFIKDDKVVVKDWVKQTIATIGENIKVKRFVRYNLGEGLEKKSQDFAAEVAAQTAAKAKTSEPEKEQAKAEDAKETVEKSSAVAISAALVKQLREETGAGMMDCKKALSETGGDLEKGQEYLRKKGLSSADKKSSRLAAEGRIGSYIHDSRIGVLIEVNCETDFVGRSEKFKELVDDLAMQAVACPQVQYVSVEDIPEEIAKKEKEIEMQREDILSKPENIRERSVEGRVSKRLGELALLEQPFIKDDSVLVKDLVKQSVAALGENIKVRRFVKFTLGEESS